jgi:ABC-type transport system involved in multi-copper enzyme maturation permease subunit
MKAPEAAAFASVLVLLAALLLPMSFHLRERSEGTLGQLAALPITRAQLIRLRYWEALLLPAAALLLLFLAGLLVNVARPNPGIPLATMLRDCLNDPMFLGWLYFWWFAYPLPAVLRWGGKGLALAAALPIALGFGLGLLLSSQARFITVERIWRATAATPWAWITTHQPIVLVILLALFFALSLKALAAEDL